MKRFLFNKALRILLVTNALILLAAAMLGPIYALFVKEIGGDLLDASFAGAIFAFIAGTVSLVSGRFSDQIKNKELIMAFGYAIMGLGFALYVWANSIVAVFLIQVVIGLGEAIYSPAFDAIYSKHLDAHNIGKEWGAWEAINYFTGAIGAIVGGLVVTIFGFGAMFIVMSVFCFFSAMYIYFLPREVL